MRFSLAGDLLATSGNDGILRLWQPRTGQRLRELAGTADRLVSVLFSPAGGRLATASSDGRVYFWNAGSGAYEREMNVETDHLWAEAFSPDGNVLATANDDDTVRLWYCTTGRHFRTFGEPTILHGRDWVAVPRMAAMSSTVSSSPAATFMTSSYAASLVRMSLRPLTP